MITGTITYAPELQFTPSGIALIKFNLKTLDSTVHCIAWESLAEDIAGDNDYFTPNVEVIVTGYFKTRKWYDGTGAKVTRREYTVQTIRLA